MVHCAHCCMTATHATSSRRCSRLSAQRNTVRRRRRRPPSPERRIDCHEQWIGEQRYPWRMSHTFKRCNILSFAFHADARAVAQLGVAHPSDGTLGTAWYPIGMAPHRRPWGSRCRHTACPSKPSRPSRGGATRTKRLLRQTSLSHLNPSPPLPDHPSTLFQQERPRPPPSHINPRTPPCAHVHWYGERNQRLADGNRWKVTQVFAHARG